MGRCVILVDDGLAIATTAAAVAYEKQQAARIVVAVPIGSCEACTQSDTEVDEVICGRLTDPFHAIGSWYENFAQLTDEDVGQF